MDRSSRISIPGFSLSLASHEIPVTPGNRAKPDGARPGPALTPGKLIVKRSGLLDREVV
jgi:hypothetical protein